eukprot:m.247926 g.247926  ORF g.247926 m.247926 type:complete len:223 (-) comp19071_c0_seq19:295-963(-)
MKVEQRDGKKPVANRSVVRNSDVAVQLVLPRPPVQTAVAKKCGAAAATPTFGGLLVPCDKAEQLLALCATAVSSTAQDNDPAASLVLHCGAADYFDEGKGKYAMVTGQTKDALELVDDVAAATKAQPLVSAIIDPFAAQHGEAWVALKEALAADASGGSDQSPNLWCMDDVGQGVTLGKDVVSAAVLSLPHAGTVGSFGVGPTYNLVISLSTHKTNGIGCRY